LDEPRLFCVPPEKIHQLWPHARPFIVAAIERGGLSNFSEIESALFKNLAQLWIVWDGVEMIAAAVTELQTVKDKKFCSLTAVGGKDFQRWLHLLSRIENFAHDEGCKSVRIMGREGWGRILKDYKQTRVILEKEI
jgi:hypothetical protein